MPRLFISHSSKDNAPALAFQNWLVAAGWTREDVFIDLHGIGAGERWRDTLRKASKQCEAVIMLASPASLESIECQREMSSRRTRARRSCALLRPDKGRSAAPATAKRQFVDLSAEPTGAWSRSARRQSATVAFNLAALNAIRRDSPTSGSRPKASRGRPRA